VDGARGYEITHCKCRNRKNKITVRTVKQNLVWGLRLNVHVEESEVKWGVL